jgi:glycyl-tRNA synthetase beta chain
MAKDFLLEIGMEEVPARFLRGAVDQLHDKIAKWFADNHIGFDTIEKYATPRRITVIAKGVAEKQADVDEQVKGPAKKIALNEAGEWSPAALWFDCSFTGRATQRTHHLDVLPEKHALGPP